MAVTPKPKSNSRTPAVDVETLINKGGSSPAAKPTTEGQETPKPTQMLLRIPPALMTRLDAALQARAVRLPRHTWILEAIAEKLDRDGK